MTIALIILGCLVALFVYIFFTPNGGLMNHEHQLGAGPENWIGALLSMSKKIGIVFVLVFAATVIISAINAFFTVIENI